MLTVLRDVLHSLSCVQILQRLAIQFLVLRVEAGGAHLRVVWVIVWLCSTAASVACFWRFRQTVNWEWALWLFYRSRCSGWCWLVALDFLQFVVEVLNVCVHVANWSVHLATFEGRAQILDLETGILLVWVGGVWWVLNRIVLNKFWLVV